MTYGNVKQMVAAADRIVVKIGSALIVDDKGGVKTRWLKAFAQDIADLKSQGKDVIIVSSGAISIGRKDVGIALNVRPSDIPLPQKQAASAVGQFQLFAAYHKAFFKNGLCAAQVLLTMTETENRKAHLNARATMEVLLAKGIVPIINENDTISTGEIRFGDNDRLAVRVAQMMNANAVILLSTVDGMYSADPSQDENARHIAVIDKIDENHTNAAREAAAGLSTGGMKSKLKAAHSAMRAGIALVIASGVENNSLSCVCGGRGRCTLFVPQVNNYSARRKWLQSHLHPCGKLVVDDGALQALKGGASLLPIGVVWVEGNFQRGDAITIVDKNGVHLGVGLSLYSSDHASKIARHKSNQIAKILGYIGSDAIIHRNDMALD